ncbi:MAG: hypothetical protein U0Q16_36090 [Bryobacteraceae bacterium]
MSQRWRPRSACGKRSHGGLVLEDSFGTWDEGGRNADEDAAVGEIEVFADPVQARRGDPGPCGCSANALRGFDVLLSANAHGVDRRGVQHRRR